MTLPYPLGTQEGMSIRMKSIGHDLPESNSSTSWTAILSNTMVFFGVRTHLLGLVKYIISRRFKFLLQYYGETGTI